MSLNKAEPWRSSERHFCAICNSWMGSDRQSILLHENGKKHKEQLEASIQNRRDTKVAQERAANALKSSLAAMNAAAVVAHLEDVRQFGNDSFDTQQQQTLAVTQSAQEKLQPVVVAMKQEKKDWAMRKKKRQEEKKQKEQNDGDDDAQPALKKAKHKPLGENEGHYIHDDAIYLEGPTYANLMEEDLTIQLWTGNVLANLAEKRLLDKDHYWIKALVVQVRKSSKDPSGIVVDVAFLKHMTDDDETIETSVSPDRIRILLGSDDKLPDTLEEARLAIVGEQVIAVHEDLAVDDNTGLSCWGTVEIRKTTVRNEEKEKRDRERLKKRQEKDRLEKELKEAESRKMEEQKVDNAEDSALGAYDVWSSGKAGYKGVDINTERKLNVADTAKSLAKGLGTIEFKKKSMFKAGNKKQNRRTTSADDD